MCFEEKNNVKKVSNANSIVSFNILSTLILQGLTFFTAPIISRMLGAENYGVAAVYVTWVSLASTIFGFQTQSTLAPAQNEFTKIEQSKYQSSVFCLSGLTFFSFSIIVLLFAGPISKALKMRTIMIPMLLIHAFGQYAVTFINTKFTYEFDAKKNFFLTVLITSTSLALSLILISVFPGNINYWGRVLGLAIPYAVAAIFVSVLLYVQGKMLYCGRYWKFCLSLCVPIIFHNVSNIILNQSDRVMIQSIMTNSYAGIYSLAYSFGTVLSAIWTALNNSWVPFYYELSRQKKYSEMMNKAKNYIELFTVVSVGFVLLSPEVFHIFASKEYWNGTQLIPIFAVGFFFMFMYSFPVNYEFYNKKTKLIALGTFLSAAINIILNYVLIKWIGILGAAIATAVSYAIQFIFHNYCAIRIEKKNSMQDKYLFGISCFAPYLVFFCVFVVMWHFMESLAVIRWIIAIMIGLLEMYRIIKRKAIF